MSTLTDRRFFTELLDGEQPSLRPVIEAARDGDNQRARALFASVMRRTLQPQRYLGLPLSLGDNAFMAPDEDVASAAERILTGQRVSCAIPHAFTDGIDWQANPTPNNYQEWTWQLNRHHDWVVLGEQYRQTGDERFAERLVAEFRSWREQVLVPRDAPGYETRGWRTIETGIRMNASWPWALHCLLPSPHLDDDVLTDWCKSVWEHGWRLRNFHRSGNWLIMELSGLAQVGLLFPVFERSADWQAYALKRMVQELNVQICPDGFQYEFSTHTHQLLVLLFTRFEAVMARYDVPMPEICEERLLPIHAVNVRMMMPDGRLPNLNNGSWARVAPLMEEPARRYPERQDFQWAATAGAAGQPPRYRSTGFSHAGYVVFRNDWSSEAVWALFDGGPYGFRHHHEDKLNLLIHAYGRLLLTEAGKHGFDGSAMHQYVLTSAGHNTVLVDHEGQNRKANFRPSEVSSDTPADVWWQFGGAIEGAESMYDEGYGPAADRCASHHRRVLFLKSVPGLAPCFLVIDRLKPLDDEEHSYQALWHLAADQVRLAGRVVQAETPNAPGLSILVSQEPDLKVIKGQREPVLQGWIARPEDNAAQEIPTLEVSWRSRRPTRMVTLLWPSPSGQICPIARIEADDDPAETQILLHFAEGEPIRLDERSTIRDASL